MIERGEIWVIVDTLKALEAIQAALPAPTGEEIAEMGRGARPMPLEAHWIARLQRLLAETEAALEALRESIRRETSAWLLELFRSGRKPAAEDFAALAAARGFRQEPWGGGR